MSTVKVAIPKAGFIGSDGRHYRPDHNSGMAEIPKEIYEQVKDAKFMAQARKRNERRAKARSIYASERKNEQPPKDDKQPEVEEVPQSASKLGKFNKTTLVGMSHSMGLKDLNEDDYNKEQLIEAILEASSGSDSEPQE